MHPVVLLGAFCYPLVDAVTSISASTVVFRVAAPQPGSFLYPALGALRRRLPLHGGELHEDPRSALPPRVRREEDLGGASRVQLAGGWEED
jgi:hypothetical protein